LSWGITPTEDAKASSAFFKTANFIGAYGVLIFSKDTLRVLMVAVASERLGFFIYTPSACGCLLPRADSDHGPSG
jgi:hypothetical protein